MNKHIASIIAAFAVAGCITPAELIDQGGKSQKADLMPILQRTVTAMAVGEPPVAWHANPDLIEFDLSILLPGNRLLVGATDLSGFFGAPSYGPLVALDAGTGKELWRFARTPEYDAHYDVIATNPISLIVRAKPESSEYSALDPDKGTQIWQRTINGAHRISIDPDGSGLVLVENKGAQIAVSRLDPKTGNAMWVASRPAPGKDEPLAEIVFQRDEVLILDRDLTRWSSRDGRVIGSVADVGPLSPSSFVLRLGDGIVVGTADGRMSRLSYAGRVLWQSRVEGAAGVVSEDGARLYVQSRAPNGSERISALALADGKLLWSQPIDGAVRSSLLATSGSLVFTIELPVKGRALDIRDPRSGARRLAEPLLLTPGLPDLPPGNSLPLGVQMGSLADHLLPYPSRLVVAQEWGVASFALPSGERQWTYDVRQYSDLTFGRQAFSSRLTDAKGQPARPAGGAPVSATAAAANFQRAMTSPLAVAQRHQAAVFDATRPDVKSSSSVVRQSAHEARIGAIQSSISAAETQHAAERAATQQQLVSASMEALSTLLGYWAEKSINAASRDAQVKRNVAGLKWSPQIHSKSVQGDYYLRPFFVYGDRLGVLVVNMTNGRWCEITTMPNIDALMARGMRTQLPTVTPTGQLVLRGTGTDPSIWTPFVWDSDRIPRPGLLAYDLGKLKLHDPGVYPSRVALKQWGIVSASPSSIKKGDRVISLVPLKDGDGKALAAGARFTVATSPDLDSYRTLWLTDSAGGRASARDYMLRKEGALWPTFPKGSTVILGKEGESFAGVGYLETDFRARTEPMWEASWGREKLPLGQTFTVEGGSADGTFTLVTTSAGAKYYIPHTLLVASPPGTQASSAAKGSAPGK